MPDPKPTPPPVTHGSETFFIEGEGVLTSQVGGRSGTEADTMIESDTPSAGAPKALAAAAPPPLPVLPGRPPAPRSTPR